MRKKLSPEEKRSEIIGIKVKKEIKEKLKFISDREARAMSTQIDLIIKSYIEKYFEENDIDWSDYIPQKEGKE